MAAKKKASAKKRTPAQRRATAKLVAMNKKKRAAKKKPAARRAARKKVARKTRARVTPRSTRATARKRNPSTKNSPVYYVVRAELNGKISYVSGLKWVPSGPAIELENERKKAALFTHTNALNIQRSVVELASNLGLTGAVHIQRSTD